MFPIFKKYRDKLRKKKVKEKTTTIRISTDVRDKLQSMGAKGDTYEKLIYTKLFGESYG
jgi:hypothetical protein